MKTNSKAEIHELPLKEAALTQFGGKRITRRAELQSFLRDTYRLEFNELTRVCEINGSPLEDHHLADSFLAQQHGIEVSKQMAADSFEFISKSNPYNPVQRYLQGLRERSDLRLIPMQELAAAFAIETGDEVSICLLASHLAGAAMRGLTPGHKHDQILVIRGEQGTFKSSSIEALAGPWYDSATRVKEYESKDFLARINGAWLFEIDECEHTLLRRTAAEFKGFNSRRNDRYAEKYEKTAKTHWRRSVLFGTTNDTEFLDDATGNRRAWIIDTGNRNLDPQWISANRDCIWATVLTWIDWGLSNHFAQTSELAAATAERAQQSSLSDAWEPLIAKELEAIPLDQSFLGISQEELMTRALHISPVDCKRDAQMRVTRIVTGSGFRTPDKTNPAREVAWKSKKCRFGGGRPRAGYCGVILQKQSESANSSRGVPTVPPHVGQEKGVGTEDGTVQMPWQNKALTTPFQPFKPYLKENLGIKGELEQGDQKDVTPLAPDVGTGQNTPEMHCAASILPVPMGLERQGGWNGTVVSAAPSACPAAHYQPAVAAQDQIQQQSTPIQNSSSMPNQNDQGFPAPTDRLAAHRERLNANPIQCGSLGLGDHFNDLLDQDNSSFPVVVALSHEQADGFWELLGDHREECPEELLPLLDKELGLVLTFEQLRALIAEHHKDHAKAGYLPITEQDLQLQAALDQRFQELVADGSFRPDMQDLPAPAAPHQEEA